VVAVLPDFSAMVSYAISNYYRILIVPVTASEGDLYFYKRDWDRAAASGILVVLPHHASPSVSRKPQARRLSPPRLSSAITVGAGVTTNQRSFGPGLEVFDDPSVPGFPALDVTEMGAAAAVAGKLAVILDRYPAYNSWDARQHLRQVSSLYATGWIEDGGYGRVPKEIPTVTELDPAPPLETQAVRSPDGRSVAFSWQNSLQTGFSQTAIIRQDGRTIYQGNGTNYLWHSDLDGIEEFRFVSIHRGGRLSKPESYTIQKVEGLKSRL
ncbi:MAG TPA: hypothetical protein VEC99_03620, partial [Clostridia bacterium]|nr:hypothetical protein [Clostridia bacterium]